MKILRRAYGDCMTEGGAGGPRAVIIGDSYLGRTKGSRAKPVAISIGERMGWRYYCRVRGGTGFISPGASDTFCDRIARAVTRGPQVLLVVGGGNDNRHDHVQVERAAAVALTRARDFLPATRIVLVGPMALHQIDRSRMADLGRHLAAAAAEAGVEHVDASSWFMDAGDLVISDGVHPNERGAAALTDKLVSVL